MAKKFGGFPGGANMNNMIRQAQKMQQEMLKAQEEIEQCEFETSAGGGAVSVKINGKLEVQNIEIDPDVVDPDDVETLQDILVAGVNEAIKKVEDVNSEEMSKITGGISMPGLF